MQAHHSILKEKSCPRPSDTSICFDAVHFGYDAGYQVLRGISFEIGAGQMVALAGAAGSGKRTCARLLQGLGAAEAGAVRIGGVDVRDLPAPALDNLMAIVPRDCRLAHHSLDEIFKQTKPDTTRLDMEEAARQARIHDIILDLPEGYDAPCDVWRAHLTAGQRQRIALACAVLGQAPILILDEATAGLDAGDLAAWQAALADIRRGRTILMLSHRLSTLKMADAIVVLEQGVVVEEGAHAPLVAWNDRYARLIASGEVRG